VLFTKFILGSGAQYEDVAIGGVVPVPTNGYFIDTENNLAYDGN
jgi:hypothetical protein